MRYYKTNRTSNLNWRINILHILSRQTFYRSNISLLQSCFIDLIFYTIYKKLRNSLSRSQHRLPPQCRFIHSTPRLGRAGAITFARNNSARELQSQARQCPRTSAYVQRLFAFGGAYTYVYAGDETKGRGLRNRRLMTDARVYVCASVYCRIDIYVESRFQKGARVGVFDSSSRYIWIDVLSLGSSYCLISGIYVVTCNSFDILKDFQWIICMKD